MHQMSANAERAGVARGEALRDPVSDETRGTTHETEGTGSGLLLEALARQNLLKAMKRVKTNKGAAGIDGMEIDLTAFLRPGDIRQLKNKHIEIITGNYNYLRITPPEIKRNRSAMVSMPQAVGIYKRVIAFNQAQGYGRPEDYVFFPQENNRQFALSTIGWLFSWILKELGLKKARMVATALSTVCAILPSHFG